MDYKSETHHGWKAPSFPFLLPMNTSLMLSPGAGQNEDLRGSTVLPSNL